jgi:hypothetical protein
MDLMAWIAGFAELHEKAKKKALSADDLAIYQHGRDELARAMVAAQRLTLKQGQTPRQMMRVARAVQIELQLISGPVRALTSEISRGGFSAMLPKTPRLGEVAGFKLSLPDVRDPLVGRCKVLEPIARQGSPRTSFSFEGLGDKEIEAIDMMLFDAVIAQFRSV